MPEQEIEARLLALQDWNYREFHRKLVPTVNPEGIIGIRVPKLRALAKEIAGTEQAEQFLNRLPHRYYEENCLHGLLIEQIESYERAVEELERFLPFVDNWVVCDLFAPKVFRKHLPELYGKIPEWLKSSHPYTVRYALELLMRFYLEDGIFRPEMLELAVQIKTEEYYVRMMTAWYLATALAKQYPAAVKVLEEGRLEPWTHRKTIQKAVESYRIPAERKEYLKTLRRTEKTV